MAAMAAQNKLAEFKMIKLAAQNKMAEAKIKRAVGDACHCNQVHRA